jgi:hypothetical protein
MVIRVIIIHHRLHHQIEGLLRVRVMADREVAGTIVDIDVNKNLS